MGQKESLTIGMSQIGFQIYKHNNLMTTLSLTLNLFESINFDKTHQKLFLSKMQLEAEENISQVLNQKPTGQVLPPRKAQDLQAKIELKYLRPSQKIKVGMFGCKQFDLRFEQLKDTMVTKGLFNVLTTFYPQIRKYKKQHPQTKNEPAQQDNQQLQRELAMFKPDWKLPLQNQIKYTWIGHSTAVIQIGPDNLIIDPVFSTRASPVQFAGPRRFRPPACAIKELPNIHLALISHDHYDHLDTAAIDSLYDNFNPIFVAGLGTQDCLPKKSKRQLLDWMAPVTIQTQNKRKYKITFVPVCHWSKRGLYDLNTRLWGGFVIETPQNKKLFYSGDTGYCDVFKEIGQQFGPFDFCILPIGAYEPRSVLKPQHTNPQEAVIIHKEIKNKRSVGVHWGTFPLGSQGYFQAKYDLADARKKHGLKQEEFVTVNHGLSTTFRFEK